MGLLTSIGAAIGKVAETVGKVVNTLKTGTLLTAVVAPTESKIAAAGAAGNSKINKAVGGAILATSAVAAAAVVNPPAAIAVAKKVLIPTGTVSQVVKGTVARVAVAGVVAGGGGEVLVKAAEKTIETTYAAGQKVGEIISTDKQINSGNVKEVAETAAKVLGIGVAGAAVGVIAEKVLESKEEKAIEEVKQIIPDSTTGKVLAQSGGITVSEMPTNAVTPITPQTQVVSPTTSTSKKRKRKVRKAIYPSVRQNVQVIVQNRNVGQIIRYKKESVLN
jgi:hypothetical protein